MFLNDSVSNITRQKRRDVIKGQWKDYVLVCHLKRRFPFFLLQVKIFPLRKETTSSERQPMVFGSGTIFFLLFDMYRHNLNSETVVQYFSGKVCFIMEGDNWFPMALSLEPISKPKKPMTERREDVFRFHSNLYNRKLD